MYTDLVTLILLGVRTPIQSRQALTKTPTSKRTPAAKGRAAKPHPAKVGVVSYQNMDFNPCFAIYVMYMCK